MIYTAAELRAKAQEKIDQDRENMDDWIDASAEGISEWCEEQSEEGYFSCHLSDTDLKSIMPFDIAEGKVDAVIRLTIKLLEEKYYYKIVIDDFVSKSKSPSAHVQGITISWS